MKKRIFSVILALFMVISLLPSLSIKASADVSSWEYPKEVPTKPFSKGEGTDDNPYQIGTPQELANLAYLINENKGEYNKNSYKLTNDIELNDFSDDNGDCILDVGENCKPWEPIGESRFMPFKGTFNGDGHTVSGIYIKNNSLHNQGLFGNVDSGTIKNVGILNSYIENSTYIGGLVGKNKGTVTNCYNAGIVNGSNSEIGGLVGSNEGTVSNCYNACSVNGSNRYIGGLVGNNKGTVTNCYNIGKVIGGGVIGINWGEITNCYDASFSYGIVWKNKCIGRIANCYYDKQMCPRDGLDKLGVEGKLTSEMVGEKLKNSLGGDSTWKFEEGLYPRLAGMESTDIAIVSATPVFLDNEDNVLSIKKHFNVGIGNGVTWTSSDPGIIYINNNGKAILKGDGSNIALTASLGGVSKEVTISNVEAPTYKVSTPNEVEINGITATTSIGTTSYTADSIVTISITLYGEAKSAGIHTIGLTSADDVGKITFPSTATKTVELKEQPEETFEFTFTMPTHDVDDLKITHTFVQAQSTTPSAAVTTVTKKSDIQSTVDFSLNTPILGTWKVYDLPTSGNVIEGVTASVEGKTLTLTHANDIPVCTYYVSVTEEGKAESSRLALTVGAYNMPTYDINATTNKVLVNGVTATATFGESRYIEGAKATVTIALSGTAEKKGTHVIGLTSVKAGTIIPPKTVTKTVEASDTPTDTFVFTFTMPANAVDDLVVMHTFNKASSGGGGTYIPPVKPDTSDDIIVNGKSHSIGQSSTTTQNGKTVTIVTIDNDKLKDILELEKNGISLTILITGDSNKAVGVLNGQIIKQLQSKEATLEIRTNSASYTLLASDIDIDSISEQFGNSVALKDINVEITIAEPSDETIAVVKRVANEGNFSIMVPAVDFSISCTYNGQTTNISSFNSYVKRSVAIPDGVDHTKITTGIVINSDGTTRHVPTKIIVIDGKYYAEMNSLTNSTYTVVYNPIKFSDVTNHWAKNSINDMGSRMVVSGVGDNNFIPDRSITRAEVAAIIVRALGLDDGLGEEAFSDVNESDWYCGYIKTAVSYGLINGYVDGTFHPNDKITREQAMTMIARAMKKTGLKIELTNEEITEFLSNYTDSTSISDYAKESIATCIKTEIIKGRNNGYLASKDNISRAEVAVIVQRLLQKSDLI